MTQRLNGVGAPIVQNDFGGLWDDVSNWASTTLDKTLTNLQTQATKSVTQAVQNYVVKLTGADGKTASVTLTPTQLAQYQQSGTIPANLLPAGFVQQKSFMEQYGTYIMMGAGALALVSLVAFIVTRKGK